MGRPLTFQAIKSIAMLLLSFRCIQFSPSPLELSYPHYTLEDPNKKVPLGVFEAQPTVAGPIVCVCVCVFVRLCVALGHTHLLDPFIISVTRCIGKRIACMEIQVEAEDKCSFVITGNTWAFRQRLDAHGVSLGYTGENEARKYMVPKK